MEKLPEEQVMVKGTTQSEELPAPKNGQVEVKISGDLLQAFLIVTPPEEGGSPVSIEEALEALDGAGVKHGIDREAVGQAVAAGAKPTRRQPVPALVARGQGATPGRDAYITFSDLLQKVGGVPEEREDGSVDFFNLNIVRNVSKGTVLAAKTEKTTGVQGITVTGLAVPAPDGKDVNFKAGKGTVATIGDNGHELLADMDGHAVLDKDGVTVSVQPVFEIKTDVGPETGHIDFVGTVVVKGTINSGYVVKAGQNLEVHGGIDGGTVEAGGNVTVKYGIQGGGRGYVIAGGNVTCRFMENAQVQAKGDITVTDGLLHSVVRCGGKVLLPGRKGWIVGGQVRAKEQVVAKMLGSSLATPTEVEVGTDPTLKEELEAVMQQLKELEGSIKKTHQVISLLKDIEAKQPSEFTDQRRETLLKALHSLRFLTEQRKEMLERKKELENSMQLAVTGTVRVSDLVYPGVRVIIGNDVYIVGDTMHHTQFYYSTEEGEVKAGSA